MNQIVITGAGSGIGRATAILLSQRTEDEIILVGRNNSSLEETKNECSRQASIHVWDLDIRDRKAWQNAIDSFPRTLDIRVLFANAGAGGENHYGDDDRWDEIISTNLTGTYITIFELLPFFKKSDRCNHIVITSSCLGRFGVPDYTAYCAAKTGLLGLTRALAVQYASENILVNAICPGWVDTAMARNGIALLANREDISFDTSFEKQKQLVPTGRFSAPEEIAEFVAYLTSEHQRSITGQGLDINNGSYMS
jgi:NAD(P)-dependent dehydrogenase (short-subunit alcohol dehydrogenase family)